MPVGTNDKLTPSSLTHEARYAIRSDRLARLLGIKIPEGAAVSVEHISDSSGRAVSIGPEHTLVIRVSWTEEETQEPDPPQ